MVQIPSEYALTSASRFRLMASLHWFYLLLILRESNTNGNIRFINEETRDRNISVEAKIESTMSVGMGLYCVGLKSD